ncbi:MAG TPA: hypothetical protein VFI56_16605 [Vicinamibacterales bacterium]|nr:hypothetical protein [Vicinamibacterales bacterium]
MQYLVVFILSAEKALRLKTELGLTKLDCHGLYFDGKLLKCVRMAAAAGLMNWD